jgi:hypothetical protein
LRHTLLVTHWTALLLLVRLISQHCVQEFWDSILHRSLIYKALRNVFEVNIELSESFKTLHNEGICDRSSSTVLPIETGRALFSHILINILERRLSEVSINRIITTKKYTFSNKVTRFINFSCLTSFKCLAFIIIMVYFIIMMSQLCFSWIRI